MEGQPNQYVIYGGQKNAMEKGSKNLIMIPYAELEGAQSGANIGSGKNRQELYYQLCSIALMSARHHNGQNTDIALVTNTDVPGEFKDLFEQNNILVIRCKFDAFFFGNDYKWCLAFYKLCAFEYVVKNYDYACYAYMDTDVYIKGSFDNIWEECADNILLYDFNSGLNDKFYRRFLDEVADFLGERRIITHYGGEFCACNRADAKELVGIMRECFENMRARGFETKAGDEFILSVSAHKMKNKVKNAGAYVFRYWTGDYRLVTSAHKYGSDMVVLHCPQEKRWGFTRIYAQYISKGKIPGNQTVYRLLHLDHRRLRIYLSALKARILGGIIRR